MSPKKTLEKAGYHLVLERDATVGWEYLVENKDGRSVASGWTMGTKTEAAQEALADVRDRGLLGEVAA
jgi:hypothetical protein